MEKKSETGLCKHGMCGFASDVILGDISLVGVARRSAIKNSLTVKCENCTTRVDPLEPLYSAMVIRLEHVDNTASSWSFQRQSA